MHGFIYCGAGFQVCEGLGTDAQFYRNVPLGIPGVGHRSVEMRICSPRFFKLRDRFGYRRLVSVKCSPCLLKKMGSYFEKPASVPKLMQTMGNISYQSLDCAQKSRKSRKTVGNKITEKGLCAQIVPGKSLNCPGESTSPILLITARSPDPHPKASRFRYRSGQPPPPRCR